MARRKPIPPEIESFVLLASARRCALCYGFDGDLRRKKGQIAHIDQDPSNSREENLVYLCMDHHDEYDTRTSQTKGITEVELREYKQRLVAAIDRREHTKWEKSQGTSKARAAAIQGHDERLFREADRLLPEGHLRTFLDQLGNDHSYWLSVVRDVDRFRAFFMETGNQFINERISGPLGTLLSSLDQPLGFLAFQFFVFPNDQHGQDDMRFCMHPKLNVDRGDPDRKGRQCYERLRHKLNRLIDGVLKSYEEYRLAIRDTLLV